MVKRLEADLGVKVQEVHFPELRYSFQIWDAYMGLSDREGNVGPQLVGRDLWLCFIQSA